MKNRNHRLKPRLESLEDRRLLAILLDVDSRLYVFGTDSAETIRVSETSVYAIDRGVFQLVPGIKATRTNAAGKLVESQSFQASKVTSLHVSGLAGSDAILNDTALPATIDAGSGRDTVFGGSSKDVITGGGNSDLLWGNGGDDELFGGGGADSLHGGPGDDILRGDGGADWLFGGGDDDDLAGGTGPDVLLGSVGNDSLKGNAGADWLLGGSGNDDLHGGSGRDFLFGDTPSTETMETLAEDMDVAVPANLTGDLAYDGGAAGDDTLSGSSGSDVMFGEEGDDEMHGGGGDDFMYGGTGSDFVAGGVGSDWLDYELVIPAALVKNSDPDQYIFDWDDWVFRHAAIFVASIDWVEDGPYVGYRSIFV